MLTVYTNCREISGIAYTIYNIYNLISFHREMYSDWPYIQNKLKIFLKQMSDNVVNLWILDLKCSHFIPTAGKYQKSPVQFTKSTI